MLAQMDIILEIIGMLVTLFAVYYGYRLTKKQTIKNNKLKIYTELKQNYTELIENIDPNLTDTAYTSYIAQGDTLNNGLRDKLSDTYNKISKYKQSKISKYEKSHNEIYIIVLEALNQTLEKFEAGSEFIVNYFRLKLEKGDNICTKLALSFKNCSSNLTRMIIKELYNGLSNENEDIIIVSANSLTALNTPDIDISIIKKVIDLLDNTKYKNQQALILLLDKFHDVRISIEPKWIPKFIKLLEHSSSYQNSFAKSQLLRIGENDITILLNNFNEMSFGSSEFYHLCEIILTILENMKSSELLEQKISILSDLSIKLLAEENIKKDSSGPAMKVAKIWIKICQREGDVVFSKLSQIFNDKNSPIFKRPIAIFILEIVTSRNTSENIKKLGIELFENGKHVKDAYFSKLCSEFLDKTKETFKNGTNKN